MPRYYTDIRLSHPNHDLHQFLIYSGKPALSIAAGIDKPNHRFHYRLIDMHRIDCEDLLGQNSTDALALAIQCDFNGEPPQQMVNYTLIRLQALSPDVS